MNTARLQGKLFKQIDTNDNGKISRREAEAAHLTMAPHLDTYDRDSFCRALSQSTGTPQGARALAEAVRLNARQARLEDRRFRQGQARQGMSEVVRRTGALVFKPAAWPFIAAWGPFLSLGLLGRMAATELRHDTSTRLRELDAKQQQTMATINPSA